MKSKRPPAAIARLPLLLVALGLAWSTQGRAELGQGRTVKLPPPKQSGPVSVEETLARRRSVRELAGTPLTQAELGQLLWAAQGITQVARGLRSAPSAGALYPLELYLSTPRGVFRYEPVGHQLHQLGSVDARNAVFRAALGQDPIRQAPAVFVIAAVYERTARKYGWERAQRYAQMEAGHAAQNMLLQAVGLGLAAVPIGAFKDEELKRALGLPRDHEPLYLVPVGHPVH